jgi:Histidyl-tRNA synthetase
MGVERLVLLVQAVNPSLNCDNSIDIYMISSGDEKTISAAQCIAEQLRDGLPEKRIVTNYGSSNFKKQFAKADKLGAKIAVIIGENEIANQTVTIKNLQNGEQVEVAQTNIIQTCLAIL